MRHDEQLENTVSNLSFLMDEVNAILNNENNGLDAEQLQHLANASSELNILLESIMYR